MKLKTNAQFQSKYNELIGFLVVLLLIFVFDFIGAAQAIRNFAQKAVTPLLQTQVALLSSFRDPYESVLLAYTKSQYIDQLESQYAQAVNQLSELQQLREENTELRRMINTGDRLVSDKTIVGVPIVSLASPAIGVGESEGVRENQMVLVDGILVGIISSVSEHQSKVNLLSHSNEKRVIAQTESGAEGVLVGDGKNVLLTQIPRSEEVTEGEIVLTSGQEGIQKGVAVGIVRSTRTDPADATQTVVVSQLVSFYEAVLVEVR